ncbi:MAG: hypothetical protein QG578_2172 [Thermodesulfobacteriota bacterium]|nr:hypothetical protein [Thermodesulfobacteriota bacterium]
MNGIENYTLETGEFKDDDLVCYCFGYTKKDIAKDYRDNGRSVILEKIAFEKKAGGCNCAVKNPKGR